MDKPKPQHKLQAANEVGGGGSGQSFKLSNQNQNSIIRSRSYGPHQNKIIGKVKGRSRSKDYLNPEPLPQVIIYEDDGYEYGPEPKGPQVFQIGSDTSNVKLTNTNSQTYRSGSVDSLVSFSRWVGGDDDKTSNSKRLNNDGSGSVTSNFNTVSASQTLQNLLTFNDKGEKDRLNGNYQCQISEQSSESHVTTLLSNNLHLPQETLSDINSNIDSMSNLNRLNNNSNVKSEHSDFKLHLPSNMCLLSEPDTNPDSSKDFNPPPGNVTPVPQQTPGFECQDSFLQVLQTRKDTGSDRYNYNDKFSQYFNKSSKFVENLQDQIDTNYGAIMEAGNVGLFELGNDINDQSLLMQQQQKSMLNQVQSLSESTFLNYPSEEVEPLIPMENHNINESAASSSTTTAVVEPDTNPVRLKGPVQSISESISKNLKRKFQKLKARLTKSDPDRIQVNKLNKIQKRSSKNNNSKSKVPGSYESTRMLTASNRKVAFDSEIDLISSSNITDSETSADNISEVSTDNNVDSKTNPNRNRKPFPFTNHINRKQTKFVLSLIFTFLTFIDIMRMFRTAIVYHTWHKHHHYHEKESDISYDEMHEIYKYFGNHQLTDNFEWKYDGTLADSLVESKDQESDLAESDPEPAKESDLLDSIDKSTVWQVSEGDSESDDGIIDSLNVDSVSSMSSPVGRHHHHEHKHHNNGNRSNSESKSKKKGLLRGRESHDTNSLTYR